MGPGDLNSGDHAYIQGRKKEIEGREGGKRKERKEKKTEVSHIRGMDVPAKMMVVGDQRANACHTHQVSQDLQADDNINFCGTSPFVSSLQIRTLLF